MNIRRLIAATFLLVWIACSSVLASPLVWNIRSAPSSSQLNGVAFGNGLFVAVGSDTTILTSTSGREWTARSAGMTAPTGPTLDCAAYGTQYGVGGYAIGGGEGALIRSSTDGVHWTNGLSTIGIEHIHGIAYGYGVFVAVGGGAQPNTSYILTSSNGVDWTSQKVPTTNTLFGISPAYGNGVCWADKLFVAVGDRVWVRTESGMLLSAFGGSPSASARSPAMGPRLISEHPVGARVIALASAGDGEVVALLVDQANRATGIVRGLADGSLKKGAIVLGEDVAKLGPPLRGVMAASGARVAFATQKGIVCGNVEGGWRAFALGGPPAALAFVEGGETLVAAVYSEAEDTTGLVRIGSDGLSRVAALLGATQADIESDGKVCDLASDDARGVVWVVGGFGVAAFSTR